jgi:tRNA(fMet)-specific endonuclease VapC
MDRSLLDTDIYSELIRRRDARIVARATAYFEQFGAYSVSLFTIQELVKGLQQVGRVEQIERLELSLSDLDIPPVTTQVALLAGRIQGDLERTGQPIGSIDPFIAATAMIHKLTLVTGNVIHFQRIVDLGYPLRMEDWRVGDASAFQA